MRMDAIPPRVIWKNSVSTERLSCFAVVGLDEPSELLFATNAAGDFRSEISIKDVVVYSDSSVRSLGVVILHPCPVDVIDLIQAEAHEMVQAFAF